MTVLKFFKGQRTDQRFDAVVLCWVFHENHRFFEGFETAGTNDSTCI